MGRFSARDSQCWLPLSNAYSLKLAFQVILRKLMTTGVLPRKLNRLQERHDADLKLPLNLWFFFLFFYTLSMSVSLLSLAINTVAKLKKSLQVRFSWKMVQTFLYISCAKNTNFILKLSVSSKGKQFFGSSKKLILRL